MSQEAVNQDQQLEIEMAKQWDDALHTLRSNQQQGEQVAAAINKGRRLLLSGMGGSHYLNRAFEDEYRRLGLEVFSLPTSELLYSPLQLDGSWTQLLVSQSGGSAEVIRYLETRRPQPAFGLTLQEGSRLAALIPSLIGCGGEEKAYVATRSLTITMALHLVILAQLGANIDQCRLALEQAAALDVGPAVQHLKRCQHYLFSGRGHLQGMSESAALSLAEMARVPAMSIEGGQFNHGPIEMIDSNWGAILFRPSGATAELVSRQAAKMVEAGLRPVVFDLSGQPPLAGCISFELGAHQGVAACLRLMPTMQRLNLELARQKTDCVGVPRRAKKVMDQE